MVVIQWKNNETEDGRGLRDALDLYPQCNVYRGSQISPVKGTVTMSCSVEAQVYLVGNDSGVGEKDKQISAAGQSGGESLRIVGMIRCRCGGGEAILPGHTFVSTRDKSRECQMTVDKEWVAGKSASPAAS